MHESSSRLAGRVGQGLLEFSDQHEVTHVRTPFPPWLSVGSESVQLKLYSRFHRISHTTTYCMFGTPGAMILSPSAVNSTVVCCDSCTSITLMSKPHEWGYH